MCGILFTSEVTNNIVFWYAIITIHYMIGFSCLEYAEFLTLDRRRLRPPPPPVAVAVACARLRRHLQTVPVASASASARTSPPCWTSSSADQDSELILAIFVRSNLDGETNMKIRKAWERIWDCVLP